VFRIARNLALDHHRRTARRPADAAGAAPASPAAQPARQESAMAMSQALAALDDLDRDVFLMREIAGLGYGDIARACDLTPDAVRSRVHRARLRLRAHLSASIDDTRRRPMRLHGDAR
jgi:RNA polymerase sigma-70 factor (ECF subfamily)